MEYGNKEINKMLETKNLTELKIISVIKQHRLRISGVQIENILRCYAINIFLHVNDGKQIPLSIYNLK